MGRTLSSNHERVLAHVDAQMIGTLVRRLRSIRPDGIIPKAYDPIWSGTVSGLFRGRRRRGWMRARLRRRCVSRPTPGTLEYITVTTATWFVLNAKIIEKNSALSGQSRTPT